MIRTLNFADGEKLKELHAKQGFAYSLPSLDVMEVKRGYEVDGRIVAAILCRPTVELYMLSDPSWNSPRWRYEALQALHEDIRKELASAGYEDGFAWIPPQKEKSFIRRLCKSFGWVRAPWACVTRSV